jgi:hypothetical protein
VIPDASGDNAELVGPGRPTWRSVVRCLLIAVLVGYVVVRYAIRQYVRKELIWTHPDE